MKQEILETTQQNTTHEKSCKIEVLKIPTFYSMFIKEKRKYSPSLFCIDKPTKKIRPRVPTLKEYKLVIYTYLKIYFFELYLAKKTMYFCLGGFMKVVTYNPWIRSQSRSNLNKKTVCYSSGAFGLFWFYRATAKMYHMTKIKKQSGSTNMITNIEAIFNKNNNKDLLPIFTEERKKGKINKTLYKCIQT